MRLSSSSRSRPGGRPVLLAGLVTLALGLGGASRPVAASPEPTLTWSVADELHGGKRRAVARVSTAHVMPCMNYTLPTRLERRGRRLVLRVGAPRAPTICLTALGYATGQVRLGDLRPGSYQVELVHRGRTDRYRLQVSDDAFALQPASGRFSTGAVEPRLALPPPPPAPRK